MTRSLLFATAILLANLTACSSPSSSPETTSGSANVEKAEHAVDPTRSPTDRLVNKIWSVRGQPERAPGSLYVFLSNGTLVMTSCVETYRLATWRAETERRLTIAEDRIVRYEADIVDIADREARLRLHLKNESVEVALQVADVPYVCPDLRP